MTQVNVYYAPNRNLSKAWFSDSAVTAEEFSHYRFICFMQTSLDGEAAAEQMFDYSNNPNEETFRNIYFGKNRSLSEGDVVEVDGVKYLCLSMGWKVLDI